MDIGEAKITRTIFGGPRIRVICERDKKRRARMLAALVAILIAIAAWRGWVALQQMLNAPPPLPLSARIRVGPPVFDPEDFTPAAKRQKTRTQILLEGMATHRPPEPPQPPVNVPGQIAPGKIKPSTAHKPRAPLATNHNLSANQAGSPPLLSDPIQPASSVVTSPVIRPPANKHPSANKRALVVPAKSPIKAGIQPQAPASDNPLPAPDTTKP
ncbi:MAG: hypothetical protein ACYCY7_05200 [Gallionella sp.]